VRLSGRDRPSRDHQTSHAAPSLSQQAHGTTTCRDRNATRPQATHSQYDPYDISVGSYCYACMTLTGYLRAARYHTADSRARDSVGCVGRPHVRCGASDSFVCAPTFTVLPYYSSRTTVATVNRRHHIQLSLYVFHFFFPSG